MLNLPSTIGGCLSTPMFLYGLGTFAGLVVVNKFLRDSKPLLVKVTKEAIAFQQWIVGNLEESKEFWEDVFSEAKHQYRLEVERKLQILQKQQELLQKLKERI